MIRTSTFIKSQNCLIKAKLKLSGPGLFVPSLLLTTSVISSKEKIDVKVTSLSPSNTGKVIPSKVGRRHLQLEKWLVKKDTTSLRTRFGPSTHPSGVLKESNTFLLFLALIQLWKKRELASPSFNHL
jgi:hypothetical protein